MDECLLHQLAGTQYRVGYIPSESDVKRRYFEKIHDRYLELGISDLTYFDLADEYDSSQLPQLLDCDAIHLSGGDPLPFLESVKRRGFRNHLTQYLDSGRLVIGISAGAMILSRSLGLAKDAKPGSQQKNEPAAMRFFDFEFYPHFQRDDLTTRNLTLYAKSHKTTVYACDDNAGLFLEGDTVTQLGPVEVFSRP